MAVESVYSCTVALHSQYEWEQAESLISVVLQAVRQWCFLLCSVALRNLLSWGGWCLPKIRLGSLHSGLLTLESQWHRILLYSAVLQMTGDLNPCKCISCYVTVALKVLWKFLELQMISCLYRKVREEVKTHGYVYNASSELWRYLCSHTKPKNETVKLRGGCSSTIVFELSASIVSEGWVPQYSFTITFPGLLKLGVFFWQAVPRGPR